jgi:hypothetical protein
MPSLTELFTPSFLLFLGVLLLVACGLVLYFENRMREQNHKITSMLSLVSTLAEDMNGIKVATNSLFQVRSVQSGASNTNEFNESKLITVSDGEADGDEDEDEDEEESDQDEEDSDQDEDDDLNEDEDVEDLDDDDFDDNGSSNDNDATEMLEESNVDDILEDVSVSGSNVSRDEIKVLKLSLDSNKDLEFDLDEENVDNLSVHSSNSLEEPEGPSEGEAEQNQPNEQNEDTVFKTIKINLNEGPDGLGDSENQSEILDYKKLSLNKLRNIVSVKGLSNDAFRLKKYELLKLLENEQ